MHPAVPDRLQHTLAKTATVCGQGIHSGVPVTVTLAPASADHGIRFVRIDRPDAPELTVSPVAMQSGERCTALAQDGVSARTTEHLLAAVLALGLDNLRIELDAEELPILDGSAREWVDAVEQAGRRALEAPRAYLSLREPVLWSQGGTSLLALPSDTLRLTVASVTDHPVAGQQMVDVEITPTTFAARLAPARTFCYEEEIQVLRDAGLARGGSLENALVIHRDGYSSPLRIEQELAAHKALDLLGDLALLGKPLHAHVVAIRPGHAANQQFVNRIWDQINSTRQPTDRPGRLAATP